MKEPCYIHEWVYRSIADEDIETGRIVDAQMCIHCTMRRIKFTDTWFVFDIKDGFSGHNMKISQLLKRFHDVTFKFT